MLLFAWLLCKRRWLANLAASLRSARRHMLSGLLSPHHGLRSRYHHLRLVSRSPWRSLQLPSHRQHLQQLVLWLLLKAYRRALGLCYKCNAKWSKDHRCSPEVLHAVEALWELLDPDVVPAAESSDDPPSEQVFLAISKSTVFGVPAARTI